MRKAVMAMAAAAIVGGSAAPSLALAGVGCRNCGSNAGVVSPYSYYYDFGPGTYYGPGCYWRRQRIWDFDGQYWIVRRVLVC
jgi:hypothetical protein